MISQGVTAPDREAFEEWFNAFNIKEMPEYQTIRDFSFAAWQAATAAKEAEIAALKAERDAAMKDTKRVDWYEQNEVTVLHIGKCWYSRQHYGEPIRRQNSFRDAVDAAIAKAEGRKE